MGTYAKRESGETATSWPLTPTEILASSRRASGSTRRTVCSFWLATTRTPVDGGAELLTLVIKITSRADEATNNAGRRDMEHLDRLRRSAYCVPRRRIMLPAQLWWGTRQTSQGESMRSALGRGGLPGAREARSLTSR